MPASLRLAATEAWPKRAALQVTATPYAGLWDCCRSIMRREGLGTFFKSYQTTVGPSAVSWGLSC